MIVKLQDSCKAKITYGINISHNPRWGLRELSLIMGPYHDGEEHERHFLQTIGSGNWYRSEYEEFRFSKETLLLESVWFHVPEVNLESENFISLWQFEPPVEGLLTLSQPQVFNPEPTTFRWMAPNGEFLACITEMALLNTNERLRLRIANDFDLLFVEQTICGWMLSHPINYLVKSWDEPYSVASDEKIADEKIAEFLYEYLALVADPYIEQMEDEDPEILQRLLSLHNRIVVTNGSVNQRRIISDCIKDIVEQFYAQTISSDVLKP